MKVASLYSGGKDSTYALYILQQRGWEVSHLVTIRPHDVDSHLYHVPNLHLIPILSECLEIPLIQKEADSGESKEIHALHDALREVDVDGIVIGTIASDFQKSRIESVCHDLGIRCFSPLWRRDQAVLLRDYLLAGFRILIVGVSAEGLDESWLGKELDEQIKDKLLRFQSIYGLNPSGEGGEYESLVIDGPNFKKHLDIVDANVHWKGNSGIYNIMKAMAVEK